MCEEIVRGYNFYHKKLKLNDSDSAIFKIENNRIKVISDITDAELQNEIELLKKSISQ